MSTNQDDSYNWSGCSFENAVIRNKDFSGFNFAGVNFCNANLSGCCFDGANLAGAKFGNSILGYASFKHANLSNADFTKANLASVDLTGAKLCHTVFVQSMLDLSVLDHTDLSNSAFFCASLKYASFDGAILGWHSREILSEILVRRAGSDVIRWSFAGLIAISSPVFHPAKLLESAHPAVPWAIEVLQEYLLPGQTLDDVFQYSKMEKFQ